MTATASSRSGSALAAATSAVALAASLLAGCGTDANEAAAVDPATADQPAIEPNGETVTVRALDNTFRNEVVEIEAGTEVLWINGGRNEHDVLPVDETEAWGATREVFEPGDEYRHVFLEPGTYPYYCSLHGTKEVGMVGTIVVTEPAGPTGSGAET